MKSTTFKLLFSLAIPITLIGCNKSTPVFTCKIKDVKTSSFVDLTFDKTVKEFKNAGFKYGDVIEFSFKNADGKEYKYKAPFVTNYCVAGLFNCSICDYEKSGQLTISLGATDAYDEIDRDSNKTKYVNQDITFKLAKSGEWNDVNEKVDLSKKRTYNFIGRDNYIFTNTRDVKTVAGNLTSTNVAAKKIYRMSSPFDDIENGKRYLYGDSIIGDIYDANKEKTTGDPMYVLVDLNYNELKTIDDVSFIDKVDKSTNFYKKFLKDEKGINKVASFNVGDNYFSKKNMANIRKIFTVGNVNSTLSSKGLIDDIIDYSKGVHTNYAIILSDGDGIERVGFICLLLEALSGASYSTLVSDYMISYKNYYNILPYYDEKQKTGTLEKYNLIKSLTVDRLIYCLCKFNPDKPEELNKEDWSNINIATDYIQKEGLNEGEGKFVEAAKKYLTCVFETQQSAIERTPAQNIEALTKIIKGEMVNEYK